MAPSPPRGQKTAEPWGQQGERESSALTAAARASVWLRLADVAPAPASAMRYRCPAPLARGAQGRGWRSGARVSLGRPTPGDSL